MRADQIPIAEGPDAGDSDLIHVYPLFGRAHVLDGLGCWCSPEQDVECPTVIIHTPDN